MDPRADLPSQDSAKKEINGYFKEDDESIKSGAQKKGAACFSKARKTESKAGSRQEDPLEENRSAKRRSFKVSSRV